MKLISVIYAASALAMAAALPADAAHGQAMPVTVTIDENGNGTFVNGEVTGSLPHFFAADPGPGGLASVLTYSLGRTRVIPGDVRLSELVGSALVVSDVIRFTVGSDEIAVLAVPDISGSTMAFYSDKGDAPDALADVGLPTASATNVVTIPEVGMEGGNGAFYTPTANQPGFIPGFAVTYHFISDSAVPEPATWAMMLLGFAVIGTTLRYRRRLLGADAA